MAEKKNILTSSGAQKLEDELRNLKVVRRAEIAQKIKEARAQGDLTENAEYDAAKDEQAEIESRIDEIERILKNSEIVDAEGDLSSVFIGAKVRVLDMEFDEEEEIQIVGSNEANSMENKVSNESPLGMALLGAGIGDVVTVNAPGGDFQYKVLAIARQ
ncbi:MAG: transcription elongation factor GreA [Lachnospiraceae bacterium]|nr:transcription elongation factor GreA [Lachnospiraceae bacterium]